MKLCECGCGLPAPIAKDTDRRCGAIRGQPRRFIQGHQMRGKKRFFSDLSKSRMSSGQLRRFENPAQHPRWKGGEVFQKGYYWLMRPEHPRANRHGYIKRCFAVVEDFFGWIPPSMWEPHHINGNKTDDRLINLAFMTHADHSRLHGKQRGGLNYARA